MKDTRECADLIIKARQILLDKRLRLNDSGLKQTVGNILRDIARKEEITHGREECLKSMCESYEDLVKLNASYTPEVINEALVAMYETVALAESYAKTSKSIRPSRDNVKRKIEIIKSGTYFTAMDVLSALNLVNYLNDAGVDTKDLEPRIKSLGTRMSNGTISYL
jgi:hypothetical protein